MDKLVIWDWVGQKLVNYYHGPMAQEQEEGSLKVSMRSPSWGLQGL